MFSPRVPANLAANPLSRAIAGRRAAGRALIDLTLSNPTRAGFSPPHAIWAALSNPAAAVYDPQPRGLRSAREAVAAEYARRGLQIPWERIVLTASTSEAYSFLFKLLCATGDAVLTPAPGYPLFEHLTALEGVRALPYRLEFTGRWCLDAGSVDAQWDARTRAVLAVSPNNPTGSVLTIEETALLDRRCADREAALIVDEVFADYCLDSGAGGAAELLREHAALTFRLGGLSKSVALPQVKLGWIGVHGPDSLVEEALERLDFIGDTYLSVSTPAQIAAGELLAAGVESRAQVQARVAGNYRALGALVAAYPSVDLLPAEGGWSAVLRVPARTAEQDLVVQLVELDSVIVYPGFFFDFPHEAFLVVSLLPEPDLFAEGVRRLLERVDA